MTTQTTFTSRPYAGEQDLETIVEFWNTVDAADNAEMPTSIDDLRLDLSFSHVDRQRDLRLWEDPEGRLAAYARVWVDSRPDMAEGRLGFHIRPDIRNQGIEDELFGWAEERIREVGRERRQPPALFAFSRDFDAYRRALIESRGFSPARYFFRMARPLNEPIPGPQFPEGFTMRHIEGTDEEPKWVEMFNLSFIDHWNFHPLTLEDALHYLSNPKYEPERDLIAVAPDGTFAAFCFCWIDPDTNAQLGRNEGWIELLGTRRGYRNIGLGRAMLLAGLHRLKTDGVDTARLGVDAENPTGALRLYESAGFFTEMTSIAYHKEL